MEFLRPLNIVLAVVILLYSASCVYNAPVERSAVGDGAGSGCGDQVLSPDTNAQSTFYDALYVARKLVTKQILNQTDVSKRVRFYQHLQMMVEAALSADTDDSRDAQALHEVLTELSREACTWVIEIEATEPAVDVDCSNLTDVAIFAQQREMEFFASLPHSNVTLETVYLSSRIGPVLESMDVFLRNKSQSIMPQRKAWIATYISPLYRCYLCSNVA